MRYIFLTLLTMCLTTILWAQRQISFDYYVENYKELSEDLKAYDMLQLDSVVAIVGDKTITIAGDESLRLEPATSQKRCDLIDGKVGIYPNPFTDKCFVEFYSPQQTAAMVDIYAMNGALVISKPLQLNEALYKIAVSGLTAGMYNIVIHADNFYMSEKMVSISQTPAQPQIDMAGSYDLPNEIATKVQAKSLEDNTLQYNPDDVIILHAYAHEDFGDYEQKYETRKAIMLDDESSDTLELTFARCEDRDMNRYPVVEAGGQLWMAVNLHTTRYDDGTVIRAVEDIDGWARTGEPAFCYFENSDTNANNRGALYNWYTISGGHICPAGWHVATESDWNNLQMSQRISPSYDKGWFGSNADKLKDQHAWGGVKSSYDASAFGAVPGGMRNFAGQYYYNGTHATWWCADSSNVTNAWCRAIRADDDKMFREDALMTSGMSVRCVKNAPILPQISKPTLDSVTAYEAYLRFSIVNDGGAEITDIGITGYSEAMGYTEDMGHIIWDEGDEHDNIKYGTPWNTGSRINLRYRMYDLQDTSWHWAKAYATNSAGTGYSDTLRFSTLAAHEFRIVCEQSEGGSIYTSRTEAREGTRNTVRVTPDEGYELHELWYQRLNSQNDERIFIDTATKSFIMPGYDISVRAMFIELPKYRIECEQSPDGHIESSHTEASAGTEITITATPNEGYMLQELMYRGENEESGEEFIDTATKTFIMPNFNIRVFAYFAPSPLSITYTSSEGGSVSGPQEAYEGDEVHVTVSPNAGYKLTSLSWKTSDADSTAIDTVSKIFIMPSMPVTVSAVFTLNFKCGDSLAFVYKGSHELVTYGTIDVDGQCWFDRNLGAPVSGEAGDYFQWGRAADGHQIVGSEITDTLAEAGMQANHGQYIFNDRVSTDWNKSIEWVTRWETADSTPTAANPCPTGWHIARESEWEMAFNNLNITNAETAAASTLQIAPSGVRNGMDVMQREGEHATFWLNEARVEDPEPLTSKSANMFGTNKIVTSVRYPAFKIKTTAQGGTWSGNGISSNGLFNPAEAGIGTHTLSYNIIVNGKPVVNKIVVSVK